MSGCAHARVIGAGEGTAEARAVQNKSGLQPMLQCCSAYRGERHSESGELDDAARGGQHRQRIAGGAAVRGGRQHGKHFRRQRPGEANAHPCAVLALLSGANHDEQQQCHRQRRQHRSGVAEELRELGVRYKVLIRKHGGEEG